MSLLQGASIHRTETVPHRDLDPTVIGDGAINAPIDGPIGFSRAGIVHCRCIGWHLCARAWIVFHTSNPADQCTTHEYDSGKHFYSQSLDRVVMTHHKPRLGSIQHSSQSWHSDGLLVAYPILYSSCDCLPPHTSLWTESVTAELCLICPGLAGSCPAGDVRRIWAP